LLDEQLTVFFAREASVSGAAVAPRVAVKNLQGLAKLLTTTPCVELIDRRLAFRILRRNTYMYLIEAAHELTSKFSQISERTLPPTTSRALRISLRLLLILHRLTMFVCLRPFDLMIAKKYYNRAATLDETRVVSECQKALNDSLPSIGVDS
jgi:hypothetical protein